MNESPEEDEDDATIEILIGDEEDLPEDYSHGFDASFVRLGIGEQRGRKVA